jgi:hypothetical protein
MTTNRGTMTDRVHKILETSGHGFHCRVANRLREKDWVTRSSQYYIDATKDKPREIDLIADRALSFGTQFEWCHLYVRLIIECKYINDRPTMFWFDDVSAAGRASFDQSAPAPGS